MEQNNDHIYFNEARNVKEEVRKKTVAELYEAMMKSKEDPKEWVIDPIESELDVYNL